MRKEKVHQAIVEALRREFENLDHASRESRGNAGDGENRSEGKYDTRATEAPAAEILSVH
ncbi:MAG: hypothetical protein ACC661_08440 [Verrucomicrobiales bacterium]